MRILLQDLRFALRQLDRNRLYAVAAVLSMALGIGAAAAVYSVLHAVLVDPYPYQDANRIAFLMSEDRQGRQGWISLTQAEAQQLRSSGVTAGVLQDNKEDMTLTGGDLPETVSAIEFSGNGFSFLGAPLLLGREFTVAEAPIGVAPLPVAVLSYRFWKTHMNADPGVVGRTIALNHAKYTILGVVGARFTFRDGDVFLPMPAGLDPSTQFGTLVRLPAGVSTPVARARLESVVRTLGRADRTLLPQTPFRFLAPSLNDQLLGQFKGTLFLLFAAVALLLFIGCGNVAILMLARGAARQAELTTRTALGATRGRLVRQLLTEAVLVALCGGALGCMLAYGAIGMIKTLMPEYAIPHEVVIALNVPVLEFVTAVAMGSGILTGLWPALDLSRAAGQALSQPSARTVAGGGSRIRSALLTGQIALTVLLLATAAAAGRSFLAAYHAGLGVDPRNVLLLDVSVPENAYPGWSAHTRFDNTLAATVRAMPGVLDATTYRGNLPPGTQWEPHIQAIGAPADPSRTAALNWVGAHYFQAMRIPLLQGRAISYAEELRGARVAVVSEGFVQRYLPSGDPLGRPVAIPELETAAPGTPAPPDAGQPFVIVGISADVRNEGLHDPESPAISVPVSTLATAQISLAVRTTGAPAQQLHTIERHIHAFERDATISRGYSYESFLSEYAWAYDRFLSILFSTFSAVALGLAAIGLFSTLAYAVEQRTRELGIRIALGASPLRVLRTLLAPSLAVTGSGLFIGLGLSIGLSGTLFRWTQSSTASAGLLTLVSAVLLAVTLCASLLPARRALRIDPVQSLRSE